VDGDSRFGTPNMQMTSVVKTIATAFQREM
jgi:hypothetical protein